MATKSRKSHGNEKHTDEDIVTALIQAEGTVSKAAEISGISRRTITYRVKESPIVKAAMDAAREMRLQEIDDALWHAAKDIHHPQFLGAAKYYDVKHGAFDRTERLDVTSGGHPIGTVRVRIVKPKDDAEDS